jgi:hypothetical protein
MVRLSASDECTTYDYFKQGFEFLIGLVVALGGALASRSATAYLGILAGTGGMVLACAEFVHCGIH